MRTIGARHRIGGSDPGHESGSDPTSRFRTLYESTFNDIYAYVMRALVPDHTEIDDVVAEVYLASIHRRTPRLRTE
jgi:DNA-directed RNA polymerase specialized sigma24 family protein